MSAFYIRNYGDRIEILSDGAVYEPDGTLIGIREKVHRCSTVPAALTVRGAMEPLDIVGGYIDQMTALFGFDGALQNIPRLLDRLKNEGDAPAFEMVIAGFSEERGPVILYFTTAPYVPGIEPYTLYDMPEQFGGGAKITPEEAAAAGISKDSFAAGLADNGADFFELMRRKKGPNPTDPEAPLVYGIGGHVDHTVVRADGVTTTRLRTWPDAIGRKIEPAKAEEAAAA